MHIQFTGTGLLIGSIFAEGSWLAMSSYGSGRTTSVLAVVTTLLFFACMSFAMSQTGIGPKVSWVAAILGVMFGLSLFLGTKNLGLALFFFACMTTSFSFALPAK